VSLGLGMGAIRAAARRIAPHIHRTPVFRSRSLDAMANAELFFKCENLQRTGSFKIRGAANAVLSLSDEEAARGVATHSSGNHGAALACAARLRGIAAYIVVPSNAPEVKKRAIADFGGAITFCEPTLAAREEAIRKILAETGAVLIHPYNDERIITGQATAALELLEEIPDLDALLAPVSGGGLLSGTAIAAKALQPQIAVIGCEPAGADDAYRSLAAGRIMPMDNPQTIADGLRASLCPLTFGILRQHVDRVVLVSEDEIVEGMRLLWERLKLVVEPSGAVAASAALFGKLGPGAFDGGADKSDGKGAGLPRPDKSGEAARRAPRLGIILSGGNVDLARLPFR